MTETQEIFLKALEKGLGNVMQACKVTKVSRSTHYYWMNEDAEYKAAYDAIDFKELKLDFVEKAQFRRIAEGSDVLIKNYLNAHGTDRGYGELSKVKVEGELRINWLEQRTYIAPKEEE